MATGDPWCSVHGQAPCGCYTHVIPPPPTFETAPKWERAGDTFETLTLSPSIARRPRHASREAAIAAGCIPEHVTESMLCAFHG